MFLQVWEYFVNKSHRVVETRLHGNERYLGPLAEDPAGASGGLTGTETYQV